MVPYFPDVLQNWDVNVLNWIQEHVCNPFLDIVFTILTYFGEGGIFWIAMALVFLFYKKTRRTGIMMGAAMIIGIALGNGILKNVIGRVRPYDLEGALRAAKDIIVPVSSDASFPSGHSLACFECATVLMYRNVKIGIPALILSIGVGLSRIYAYVHYPTDVIAGAILGCLFALLGIVIVNAVLKKLEEAKGIHLD